jgi:hypothetical protein
VQKEDVSAGRIVRAIICNVGSYVLRPHHHFSSASTPHGPSGGAECAGPSCLSSILATTSPALIRLDSVEMSIRPLWRVDFWRIRPRLAAPENKWPWPQVPLSQTCPYHFTIAARTPSCKHVDICKYTPQVHLSYCELLLTHVTFNRCPGTLPEAIYIGHLWLHCSRPRRVDAILGREGATEETSSVVLEFREEASRENWTLRGLFHQN